jgi:Protein of unknown function (DUF3667)
MTAPQSPEQTAQPGTSARCLNCGAALTGRYCANCGQTADVHVPSTRELFHEAIEGITHSDSRLWNSLKLLWFKPGKLTQEFVAGRRAAYLPPFRLYLVLSVIFFLAASLVHLQVQLGVFTTDAKVQAVTTSEANCVATQFERFASHALAQRLRNGCVAVVRDHGGNLWHGGIGTLPKAMFILVPLIAFLHMLMYWRPRYRYAEHLLFFLHVHAFFFSAMTLVALLLKVPDGWPRVGGAAQALCFILLWSLPLYTVVAMKRVFNGGWFRTLLKGFALFVVYVVVMGITVYGVFIYSAMQL